MVPGDPWQTKKLDKFRAKQRRWQAVVPDRFWDASRQWLAASDGTSSRAAPLAAGNELALRHAAEEEAGVLADFFEACESAWQDNAVSAAVKHHTDVPPLVAKDLFEVERDREVRAPALAEDLLDALVRTGVLLLLAERAASGAEHQEPGD
ncbi:MAG: hypothetical protein ACHQNA_03860 [Acidimicrobiales bacterium]